MEVGDLKVDVSIEGSLTNLVDQIYSGEPIEIDYEDFTVIDGVTSTMFSINGTTSSNELLPFYLNAALSPTVNSKQFLCFNFQAKCTARKETNDAKAVRARNTSSIRQKC